MTTGPDNGNPSDGNGGGALESRSGEKGFAASMKKRVSTLIASSGTQIPEDELAQLLAETNFTEREIKGFYKYSSSETLSRPEFAKLCINAGAVVCVDCSNVTDMKLAKSVCESRIHRIKDKANLVGDM